MPHLALAEAEAEGGSMAPPGLDTDLVRCLMVPQLQLYTLQHALITTRAGNEPSSFYNHGIRAWLKVATTAFTSKNL